MEERVSRLEGGYEHLATKADVMAVQAEIARLQATMQAEIAGVRVTMQAEIGEVKVEIARVDGDQCSLRGEMRILATGIGLALVALNIALKFVG